ncbi:MAG TPA: efflux RND transporter periplasmic adaptor subunit [Gemmatimonadales bacterium]|nr:efflux RND transporter periplasmic adaptor subunit [Gemmatimonadales bacterium]
MGKRALAFLVFVLALGACRSRSPPPAPPVLTVQVVPVVQQDVPVFHEWVGTLDGFVNAEIKPQVSGYVMTQLYRDGAYVRRGDVLFLIDPRNYKDAAADAQATLNRAVAALEKARLDVRRDSQLITRQAISRQELDNDLTAEREAAANVDSARARLHQAQLNSGWTQVTSLIDGVAGIAQVQVGNLVTASTTLTTVSQVDPIKAQFNINEAEYLDSTQGNHWAEPGLRESPPLELILENGSVYPQRGSVFAVNRQFSAQTGTISVQGSFPNLGRILRPGQYARVRAAVETHKNALLVPQRAITELQGNYQVGVVGADSKLEIRTVQTKGQVGSMSIVSRGLSAGEKVVVSDLVKFKPGMTVHPVDAPEPPTSAGPSPGVR